MPLVIVKVIFAVAMLTALFWGGLFLWELLVRFVWKNPDLSILFNPDEW